MKSKSKHACSNKKSYRNARDAHMALQTLKEKSIRDSVPCRVFFCEWCNTWHLTSKDKNEYYG